ncbi:hypothetical protein SLA2020_224230 [Shorea laevis]
MSYRKVLLSPGSTVTYSIYSVGRMKTIWGKDCMEFRPERWLSPEGDKFKAQKDGYMFVAFNADRGLGEGLGLSSNEVCGIGGAAALPAVTGSPLPCGAEDVPDSVHEEWPSCIYASKGTCVETGEECNH